MIYSSQQVVPEATVCIQLMLPLKIHWYRLKQWIWHFAALKSCYLTARKSCKKCNLIAGNHLSLVHLRSFILAHNRPSSTSFARLSLVELLWTCKTTNRIMPKIFAFVYVETSQSFFVENLSPSYSSTTNLKTANTLQLLCGVTLFLFFFLSLYHCQFCSGRF